MMITDHLISVYDRPVPRYTSYPTAPHFHDGIDAAVMTGWLGNLPADEPLSLYLHIPFCRKMCWYCGCNTQIVARHQPIADFAAMLLKEIGMVADILTSGSHRRQVTSVHFGGGTPNSLAPGEFERIMAALDHHFALDADLDLAIELDPRTLDAEFLAAMRRTGVNRASLGVQDFDAVVQTAVNRVQPYDLVERCVADLRSVGIRALNLDLIYGLPFQSVSGLRRTVTQAVTLAPDRIALFGYAHVPWMKPHQRLIDEQSLPDGHARFRQFEAASQALAAADYARIGLDHFAKPGDSLRVARDNRTLKRNFQGYTVDRADTLIGFGPSAISALPQGYVQNAPDHTPWARDVGEGRLAAVKGVAVSHEDRRRRAIIEQIMCFGRVDLADFAFDAGQVMEPLAPLLEDGLCHLTGTVLTVTERGLPFQRVVAAVFDAYLVPAAKRHSRAV
ncbi:oxygen-independent coproporphyrinogen III oxidase [Dongia rigui]|uniref:Coproporphyrinogen-III oxidase n=1 Tax=Dongia rigui TaxID=940149 RepID=A0ABU5DY44_9PROT|nr:oxygen-independent coproporphyrinogen III oxidase [Dongia rigui]MDY0871864.1 oxygen-independent coproporphyrinogen III oxidase [Dongia rigui]